MPDIITVSESIDKLAIKARPLAQSLTISEDIVSVTAHQKIRSLSEDVTVSDALIRTVGRQVSKTLTEIVGVSEGLAVAQVKQRIITQTVNIAENLRAYKNDQELIPPAAPAIPEVPNLIGFRQRAVRAPRRPPRAILLEAELTNLIIAPLKLQAFSDSINKAIVGIRPRLVHNVALSPVSLVPQGSVITASIKTQPEPMTLKAQLALLSSPNMWARSRLKTRPESQSIHALKAVNFEKMHKLVRIMKVAMLANM
jgi:hypothetical protein